MRECVESRLHSIPVGLIDNPERWRFNDDAIRIGANTRYPFPSVRMRIRCYRGAIKWSALTDDEIAEIDYVVDFIGAPDRMKVRTIMSLKWRSNFRQFEKPV